MKSEWDHRGLRTRAAMGRNSAEPLFYFFLFVAKKINCIDGSSAKEIDSFG